MLNMTQSVILKTKEDDVRVFAVLDDAVFYVRKGDDDLQIRLPSTKTKSGYKDAIAVSLDDIELNAEDITVLYVMRIGASYLYISSILLCSSLLYLML